MSTSPLELDPIIIGKVVGSKILDIGTGYGKWGFLVKKFFWEISGNDEAIPMVGGIDIFLPHLLSLKKTSIYDFLINCNAARIPLKNNSFDTIIAVEILEHLNKNDGLTFIEETKRVAKKRVIISTPNFKCPRDGMKGYDGYNVYESHLSQWKVSELKSLGFRCYGIGIKNSFHPIIYSIFYSITYKFPRISKYIIAVFDKDA